MISIEDLTVSYGRDAVVIRSLDLQLSPAIHGIVGLNGSGKTTLLNTVYGLIKPDGGMVSLDGSRVNRKNIAYLVTENFFYSGITGREYMGLFPNKNFDIDRWNELFLLPLDYVIDGYSTGMKKKLALLGIFKQAKPVMVLDEPFNGLDMECCRVIRSVLLRMRDQGKTIIITSHIIETLTNLCDFIHYLEGGRIKYSRRKDEFSDFEQEIFDAIEKRNEKLIIELTE